MLEVYICEDNKAQLDTILKSIKNIILIEDFDMNVVIATQDPYDVIKYLKQKKSTGIYFLDVELKSDINGIELAKEIRKYDSRGFIIFITTHDEMTPITFKYKVEALDYIVKDDFNKIYNRIKEALLNANDKFSKANKDIEEYYHVKKTDKIINVEFKKILYFETSSVSHKIILHAEDRQIEFYGNLNSIERDLDKRFYKCHKSFIVNKDKISIVDKKNKIIHFKDGQKCYASVRKIKGLYQNYNDRENQ